MGMTTLGGLLELCREVTGSDAEWVPIPEADLLAAGVEPWVHLPLWLHEEIARTGLGRRHDPRPRVRSAQSPAAGLGGRHWAWQQAHERPPLPPGSHRSGPGCRPSSRLSSSQRAGGG